MSFRKNWPNIVDNVEYSRHYSTLYNALYDTLTRGTEFSVKDLSAKDICIICDFQCGIDKDKYTNLLKKAIKSFGEICHDKLYRGLNEKQIAVIPKLTKFNLAHNSSFSTSYVMAGNFAKNEDFIITIQSCNQKIFDLSYFCKVIEQLVADFNLNLIYEKYATDRIRNEVRTNWLQAYIDSYFLAKKQNPHDILLKYYYDRDVDKFRINEAIEFDEQEWIIPVNTQLIAINRDKLIFKI